VSPLLILFAGTALWSAERDAEIKKSPLWRCATGEEKHVLWRVKPGWQTGAIAVSGGRILVGTALTSGQGGVAEDCGAMSCYDENGTLLWRATHARIGRRIHDMGLPIQSKPCFDSKRAYYVSNRGEFTCVDLEGFRDSRNDGPFQAEAQSSLTNADIVWKIDMMAELGVFKREAGDVGNPLSSPIVIGDLVFCVTGHGRRLLSGNSRADPRPLSFLAANKLTGRVVWGSNAPGTNIFYGQWSSPVHARVQQIDQVIFPGGDGWLYGFEAASGRLLWKFDCNEPGAKDWFSQAGRLTDIGELKSFFVATPVVHNNVLYVGLNKDFEMPSSGPLLAIQLNTQDSTPKIKWKFGAAELGGTHTSAVVADGIVFITANQGILFALDAETGRELWHASLEDGRNLYASPVVHNGKVYAGAETAVAVFAAAREKKCFGRYEFDNAYPGTPQIAGERLYVSVGDSLWALRLPDSR
jgi:outer membrane protein assembly factor BamB